MTTDQVLKLIEAGFTAEEIRGMEKPADPEPETQPEPEQEPEPEPEKEPEPETESKPLTAEDVKQIVADAMKAAQQAANRASARRDDEKPPMTAQDVIRQLAKQL